jgi:hypothetical protein
VTVSQGDLVWLDGLFVGSLDAYERDLVDRAIAEGAARLSYEGVGGLLGLAKVRRIPPAESSAPLAAAEQRASASLPPDEPNITKTKVL